MASLTLAIDPLPCPRPRITVRGSFAHAYYPASYQKWKEAVAPLIETGLRARFPAGVPLRLTIDCVAPRPKTTKLSHPRADVDNYAKSVMDAMTTAEVWEDDKQVVSLLVTKAWGSEGSIHITVEEAP